jgi:arylsulfatase A-like enzyme
MNRPNILFLLTDQQRHDTIRAVGAPWMKTPNLDDISTRGTVFTRAYCAGATCVASRAALFTGMFAHNTGVYSFHEWGHHRNFVEDLAESGYWCASIGKMHFQPRDVRGGFHERVIVENPSGTTNWGGNGDDDWGRYLSFHGRRRDNRRHQTDADWLEKFQSVPWTDEEHLHSDAFVAACARAWLRNHVETRQNPDQPWFLQLGFPGPHEPYDPPSRWAEAYLQADDLPPPAAWNDDLSTKPPQHAAHQAFFARCEAESRINMPGATVEDIRRMRAHYFGKISYLDELIGTFLAEAGELGMLENTWIVFSSDHGDNLGDHRLPYKWIPYEGAVRVPLIIVPPQGTSSAKGITELVSLIDLAPTFLEIAGVPVPSRFEGTSLLPLVLGEAPIQTREAVYCEDNYLLMVRRRDGWKLVHYLDGTPGELYNLDEDPEETRNLWCDPAHESRRKEFTLQALEWLARSAHATAAYKCNPPTGKGFPGWRHSGTGLPTMIGPGLMDRFPVR